MSERRSTSRSRRRRRNRTAVIEEGGQTTESDVLSPDSDEAEPEAESGGASGGGKGGRTERRRGEKVQQGEKPKPNTILGMPRFIFFIMAALLVVIISVQILGQVVSPSDQIDGVVEFPDQGRRHLTDGESFDIDSYNSFPPTSGPQAAVGATPGVYSADAEDAAFRDTPAFASLLPILEQGGVIIYYDPARLGADELAVLKAFVGVLRGDISDNQDENVRDLQLVTLVEFNDALPAAIVATAWRHALEIDLLDDAAQNLIGEFVSPDPIGLYERFVLETAPPAGEGS
ncbi:MAG: Protein of unknown function (DUF3105) [Chloroflexi bacterium]|nr:MAG: Protein of unknown function (DUF3105) [Chloroflexota bacterium]